jgi:hypothetical protein
VLYALNFHENLIEEEGITVTLMPAAKSLGVLRAELDTSQSNGFVADRDSALGHEILDISGGEGGMGVTRPHLPLRGWGLGRPLRSLPANLRLRRCLGRTGFESPDPLGKNAKSPGRGFSHFGGEGGKNLTSKEFRGGPKVL